MSKAKKSTKHVVLRNRRLELVGLGLLAVIIAYLTCSRAIDTGSWWEYGYTFVLLVFALNRFITALTAGHRTA